MNSANKSAAIIDKNLDFINTTNDLAEQYNIYYEGGDESVYNKRFGANRIIHREASIINKACERILKQIASDNFGKSIAITILDYGCGDGRLFGVIEQLARKQLDKHVRINFIGYDPSIVGINLFEENLLSKGFASHHLNNNHRKILIKQNLTVKLLVGDVNYDAKQIADTIGSKIDLCLCMFGVLSHIPGRNNRVSILRMLNESLSNYGELIVSVCTSNLFSKEVAAYTLLRNQLQLCKNQNISDSVKSRQSTLRLAAEVGDFYYCSSYGEGKSIDNYTHLYHPTELISDLKSANFSKTSNVGILSIAHPFNISGNWFKSKLDQIISSIASLISLIFLSQTLPNKLGKHMYVMCRKK